MEEPCVANMESELDTAHARALDAFNRRDVDGYMAGFTPDMRYKQPNGKIIGREQLARDVRDQFRGMNSGRASRERESLRAQDGRLVEVLVQSAQIELVQLGFIRRTFDLQRRCRFVWIRSGSRWLIDEVEVLEEKITAARPRLGRRGAA